MGPMVGFCIAVAATVAFLVAVVVTGVRGKIVMHLPCVAATLASLVVAIVFAVKLGKLYDLPAAGIVTPIHLTVAKIATVSYIGPIVTGIRTLRSREHRRAHLVAALIVLALTAAASITGTLMLMWAPRLPAQ